MKKIIQIIIISIVLVVCKSNKTAIEATLEYQINSELGEGAFWNYKNGQLYWIDIEQNEFHIYNPKTKNNKTVKVSSRIGTIVSSEEKNKVIVALEDGIYTVDILTEEIKRLSDVEATATENRFNDGKCDPNGNLWVGSMHLQQTKPNAKLYKINAKGEAKIMLENVTISNGIVWSKDAKTMYYIDTPTGNIKAFDFDLKTSTISKERIAVKVNPNDGFPDGMAIDENDMLWVGMWNGNAVAQFNPKTGKLISKIKVPAHNVTSCAFGGENLDILYITTSSVDMTNEEKKSFPLAGSVFKVKPGVRGVKSNFFKTNL